MKFKVLITYLPDSLGVDYKAIDPAWDSEKNPVFDNTHIVTEGENTFVTGNYYGKLPLEEYIEPPAYINLSINVSKEKVRIGELLTFTGLFSIPIQAVSGDEIPLTILDREGKHVKNVAITVENGVVSGEVSFSKSGDYYINESGINFHSKILGMPIRLEKEILIRVME